MALLKMMGNEEELPVNDESIYLASGLEYGIVKEKLEQLKEAQLIQWRNRTASYDFKIMSVSISKKDSGRNTETEKSKYRKSVR